MKILLTGEPGVGKSTLINAVIAPFAQKQGVVTNQMVHEGARVGFEMVASDGTSFILSSTDSPSAIRVSRYGVNVDALEVFASGLQTGGAGKLTYIDEVGEMQLFSNSYKKFVLDCVSRSDPFIGTLSKVYNDDFTDYLRRRDDIEIIEVTLENRNFLRDELASRFAEVVH